MRSLALLLLVALPLAACSGRPGGTTVASPAPAAGRAAIAVVAAPDPAAYTITADSGITTLPPAAPGGAAPAPDRRPRAELLGQRLAAAGFFPGRQLTDAVAQSLRERGYAVRVVDAPQRPPDDAPQARVAAALPSEGAVLRLEAPQLGFHTPAMSLGHLPRLSATAIVSVPGRAEPLYDATFHFGVDARPGRPWAVVADERFAYPDFDALLASVDGVRAGFSAGLREIGSRIAQQVDARLAAAAP